MTTGDPAFDGLMQLGGDTPAWIVEELFRKASVREATLQCRALGASRLRVNGMGAVILEYPLGDQPLPDPEKGLALLQALGRLAEGWPPLRGTAKPETSPRGARIHSTVFSAFWLGLLGCILGLVLWAPMDSSGLWRALEAGVAVWALCAPLFFLAHRRASNWSMELFVTLFGTLLTFPLVCAALALPVNGLALGPAEPTPMTVHGRRTERSRRGTNFYYLRLSPGDRDTPQLEVEVSKEIYEQAPDSGPVMALLRRGRLGYAILDEVLPSPGPTSL